MSLRKANILSIELDETVDEAGFRHIETVLQDRLGSRLIGASVYSADDGDTIWPYHYHRGIEEWLYVLTGEPLLRDPDGQRRLKPGDFVCFPSGPGGAHTVRGPGRFVIFSTGEERHPWTSVYPDSGKISVPEGILLASSSVDYWHGEGTWKAEPGPRVKTRQLEVLSRPPVVNLDSLEPVVPADLEPPAGFRAREGRLGGALGAQMLGATLYELDPGEATAPYHYERGREEWLLVLSGAPTLRHPDGEDVLEAGDVICFVEGPAVAHLIVNRAEGSARLIILSTKQPHSSVHYPDSGKLLIRDGEGKRYVFRTADAVDYWEGEGGPG
jgi:uncharacterized cupin superfamily protein